MSILIKGMKMPKRGLVEVIISPSGICYELARPLIDTEHAKVTKYFNAIAVPDHGDLIDRDALMAHKGSAYDIDGHELYAVGTGTILRIPAVIPAERSEEWEFTSET